MSLPGMSSAPYSAGTSSTSCRGMALDTFDYDKLEKCACCDPPKLLCPYGCIELRPTESPTQYHCPECDRTIHVGQCEMCGGKGYFLTDGSEGARQLIPCNCRGAEKENP